MKIIHTCTPHPEMRNVGDHAQAVCIHRWFTRHWPGVPVREFTKVASIEEVKAAVGPGDLIFIQSGGNMTNWGTMSEGVRRDVIRAFPGNKIVQLPQTIAINGEVLVESKRIYSAHPDLTILARDPCSYERALDHFPRCTVGLFPDFVLGYEFRPRSQVRRGALLCLRKDNESILTPPQTKAICKTAMKMVGDVTPLDTIAPDDVHDRQRSVWRILTAFASHRVVVTDRLHGTIFAIVTDTPCVVLRTVNHKLDAFRYWCRDLPHVVFGKDGKLEDALAESLNAKVERQVDWNAEWLDKIPAFLRVQP